MILLYVALSVIAGAMLPLQAAINARLARVVGGPIWAAAVSGLVLTIGLAALASVATRAGARTTALGTLPWWAWTGGLCGAVVLSATTAIAPRLGTASMIALVMTGQVLSSLALDNFGLLGLETHSLSLKRVVAAALLIGGAALMM
jgi:bacterial/archaeal transporter family-2 protein